MEWTLMHVGPDGTVAETTIEADESWAAVEQLRAQLPPGHKVSSIRRSDYGLPDAPEPGTS